MNAYERIGTWLAAETLGDRRMVIARETGIPTELLAELNAVTINGRRLRAALDAVRLTPGAAGSSLIEHIAAFGRFAETLEIGPPARVGPALQARAVAMDCLCTALDPDGRAESEAFFEAAAIHPLASH